MTCAERTDESGDAPSHAAADPPGAEVLVPVQPRPAPTRESLRWTMTSRSRPIRASNSARKASMASGSPTSMPAPQACAVSRQNPTRSAGTPRASRASAMAGELVEVDAEAPAAARRVLEHEHRCARRRRRGRDRAPAPAPAPRHRRPAATPAGTPSPRCDPIWTLTNRAPKVGAPRRSVREDLDRPLEQVGRRGRPGSPDRRHGPRPGRMSWRVSRSRRPGARPVARRDGARRSGCR